MDTEPHVSAMQATDPVGAVCVQHYGWLRAWLGGRMRHAGREVVEDLAQDTVVRMLASPARLQRIELRQPRAYLTAVAKTVIASWLRRQSLERAWLQALAALPPRHHPSAEAQCLIVEALNEIDAMLASLRPPVRQAFVMATLEGRSQRDIASVLGVAVPTVKGYVRQAYLRCLSCMPDE